MKKFVSKIEDAVNEAVEEAGLEWTQEDAVSEDGDSFEVWIDAAHC